MKWAETRLSRRNFLKLGLAGLGSLAMRPWKIWGDLLQEWPDAERLGRVCVGKVNIRKRPSVDAESLGELYEDAVVIWLREVVGEAPLGRQSRRWVETPDGYIYAPSLQPVKYLPNQPVTELPVTSLGRGMWVEVTIPHTQIFLENRSPASPWLKYTIEYNTVPRLYYSQILWVDDIRTNSQGQILYRVNERFGSYGDVFWAAGEAFRPLRPEELEPIHPEVENKRIVVDVTPTRQILSCYEGRSEVYSCLISSGAIWNAAGEVVEAWRTPIGAHPIWRKSVSIHMSGGQTGTGYDLPGVAWTTLFTGEGVAIHSTFWHNDFGTPRSRGCINCTPDDAHFIFRWTLPVVPYDPGDIQVGMPGGTIVDVIEK
jgi:hypothetical protein